MAAIADSHRVQSIRMENSWYRLPTFGATDLTTWPKPAERVSHASDFLAFLRKNGVTYLVTLFAYRRATWRAAMDHIDGSAARQLSFLDEAQGSESRGATTPDRPRASLRLLRKDVYAELARRRRRAQIAARHLLDK